MILPVDYNAVTQSLRLRLYLQSGARHDAILGLHNNEIKVCVTAKPIKGKANDHLINFLARQFGVNKKAVSVKSGQKSRHKCVCILNPRSFPERINPFI